MKFVILGNSHAATGGIEGIRSIDKQGEITVLSSETCPAYGRPLISYMLMGKTDVARMRYRTDAFYEQNNVKVMLGAEAVHITPDTKTVLLRSGEQVRYDKLLYAAGSIPFVPPMQGLDTVKNKFSFMTLADAQSLAKAITKQSRVLIIGAGLIGLKCAEGIAARVQSIVVADLADRILPSVYDCAASAQMQAHLEAQGIAFRLGVSVQKIEQQTAIMTDNTTIAFDILVLAVGVRPNIQMLKDAGAQCNRGILVDACGRTSLPDIFAAGDCTQHWDISSSKNRIMAILPSAFMQGEAAGVTMAGGNKAYDNAFPINSLGLFGLHTVTAGSYEGEEQVIQQGSNYKKFFVKENQLKGFIMVGDVQGAGIYSALVRNQTKLDSLNFDLMKKQPGLLAFSAPERNEMLGGGKE